MSMVQQTACPWCQQISCPWFSKHHVHGQASRLKTCVSVKLISHKILRTLWTEVWVPGQRCGDIVAKAWPDLIILTMQILRMVARPGSPTEDWRQVSGLAPSKCGARLQSTCLFWFATSGKDLQHRRSELLNASFQWGGWSANIMSMVQQTSCLWCQQTSCPWLSKHHVHGQASRLKTCVPEKPISHRILRTLWTEVWVPGQRCWSANVCVHYDLIL